MKLVQDALWPTGIQTFAGSWKATSDHSTPPAEYLVYTTMTTESEHWDDTVRKYRIYVYLNLWTMIDPTATIGRVRAAMRHAGFAMEDETDSYNDDTRQTLVAWTWVQEIQKDIDTLEKMNAEIDALLKKRQGGYITEAEQLRLDELIDTREAIQVKYNLVPDFLQQDR